jgi:hypothetical protein
MSFIYKIAKEKMIDGTLGSLKAAGALRVALVTSQPVETDTSLPTTVGTAMTLVADQTTTGGVFGASPVVFTGVAAGQTIRGVVIYKFGTPNIPIVFIDTGTGLPQVTDGNSIPVAFPTTGSKIFAL